MVELYDERRPTGPHGTPAVSKGQQALLLIAFAALALAAVVVVLRQYIR